MSTIAPRIREGNSGEPKPELAGPDFLSFCRGFEPAFARILIDSNLPDSYNFLYRKVRKAAFFVHIEVSEIRC